jgi:hypothetical protein
MIYRVIKNNGFFEWYTVDGKPAGSGNFRGSAGVLYTAINALQHVHNVQTHSNRKSSRAGKK